MWHEDCGFGFHSMRELDYPEKHYLSSALGWLELGDPIEAKSEADRISCVNGFHPEVFLVRWRIQARLGKWEAALDLARIFTTISPDRATGWLCLSYSLFKLNRPMEAYFQLLHRINSFPKVSAIPYFLACYSWQMGDHKRAGQWLTTYKELGGGKNIKSAIFDYTEFLLCSTSASSRQAAS